MVGLAPASAPGFGAHTAAPSASTSRLAGGCRGITTTPSSRRYGWPGSGQGRVSVLPCRSSPTMGLTQGRATANAASSHETRPREPTCSAEAPRFLRRRPWGGDLCCSRELTHTASPAERERVREGERDGGDWQAGKGGRWGRLMPSARLRPALPQEPGLSYMHRGI